MHATPANARRLSFPPMDSLGGVLLVVGLFSAVHAGLRRLAGPNLAMDDAKTNLFTQVWQWGYQPDNPPLFEWLLQGFGPLTGGGLLSFLVLKYLALIVAAAFLFVTVRALSNPRMAMVVTLGAVLVYQIGWNFHQAFTHSALLVPAICAGMWAVLRAIRVPGLATFLVLGAAVGISLLTKYNAGLFWVGVVGAVLLDSDRRRALVRPSLLIVPVIAGLMLLPHALWFLGQTDTYTDSVKSSLGLVQGSHLSRVAEGMGSLAASTVLCLMPAAAIFLWGWRRGTPSFSSDERFLLTIAVVSWAALLLAVLIFGIANVSERYLIPILLPAYVGLATAFVRGDQGRAQTMLRAAVVMAGLSIIVRVIFVLFPGPPFCSDCREFIPYGDLRKTIEATIPQGAVLIVREENTGGNLVRQFPNSPVRVFTSIHLTNPIRQAGKPCYLVWSKDMIDPDIPLEPDILYMETDPSTVMVDAPWRHVLRPDGWRRMTWGITPIEKDYLYERFCTPAR